MKFPRSDGRMTYTSIRLTAGFITCAHGCIEVVSSTDSSVHFLQDTIEDIDGLGTALIDLFVTALLELLGSNGLIALNHFYNRARVRLWRSDAKGTDRLHRSLQLWVVCLGRRQVRSPFSLANPMQEVLWLSVLFVARWAANAEVQTSSNSGPTPRKTVACFTG